MCLLFPTVGTHMGKGPGRKMVRNEPLYPEPGRTPNRLRSYFWKWLFSACSFECAILCGDPILRRDASSNASKSSQKECASTDTGGPAITEFWPLRKIGAVPGSLQHACSVEVCCLLGRTDLTFCVGSLICPAAPIDLGRPRCGQPPNGLPRNICP